jgi:multimeric flavodoxin WrbA
MKVVILDGTHNKKGYTLQLVDKFIEGIRSTNPKSEIKIYDLKNEKINFCLGCNKCTEDKDPINAKCMIDDVTIEIKNKALEADIVVFASPIYEYAVSSVMKRFLERCLTMVTFKMGPVPRANPIKGKYGVVFCTSGAPFPFNYLMGIVRYPKMILKLGCKLFRCDKIETVMAGGMIINEGLKNKYLNKAFDLGAKIGRRP